MIIDVIIIRKATQCTSLYAFLTSEAFIIWALHFLAQNMNKIRLSQKNEVTFESFHDKKFTIWN